MLLVNFSLVNQTHQGEALIDFPKVQHDVLLVIRMSQPDNAGWLLIKLGSSFLVIAIDACHIDQHIDQLTTNFVVLHVHRWRVCGDVHFRDDVEEESFLNLWAADQSVQHWGDETDLWEKLLNDFGERLIDCVVINGGKLEGKWDRCFELWQQAPHICLNHIKTLDFLIITHEHVAVNLVDEDLVYDVWLNLTCLLDKVTQANASTLIVGLVSVNHIDECTTLLDLRDGVHLQCIIPWEINDVELNILVVVHKLSLNGACGQQEERFMGRHLLEHDLGNGRLAWSAVVFTLVSIAFVLTSACPSNKYSLVSEFINIICLEYF